MTSPDAPGTIIRAHPFGWLTPVILDATRADPDRLADWLAATRAEWHLAGLLLALAGDDAQAVEPLLFRTKRRVLLDRVRPGADPRLLTLAARLAGRLWPAAAYRRLAVLANDPAAVHLLCRARRITRRQVSELARVPDAYRHRAVLARLRKAGDAQRVLFAVQLVERIRPDLTRVAILRTLAQTPDHVGLEAWTRRHFRSASFPAPPRPGSDAMRPLRSWDEVQAVARAFRNCVRSHVSDVLNGSAYLYVLRVGGQDRAVVEVSRVADGQWIISEAKGPDNDDLPIGVLRAAQTELGGLPVLPDEVWIGRYCDPDG